MKKWALGALLLTVSISATAAERIALVIGNQQYTQTARLTRPVADAQLMIKAFQSRHIPLFEGKGHYNLTGLQMEKLLERFVAQVKRRHYEVVLIYYAGHGVQFNGQNYLIPVDIPLKSAAMVKHKAMSLNFILDYLKEAGSSVNVVFLDACRNNPFRGTRGLGRIAPPSNTETLISYATAANDVAADASPYTPTLANLIMTQPQLDIERLLKKVRAKVRKLSGGRQSPDYSSSFGDRDFCFGRCSSRNSQVVNSNIVNKANSVAINIASKRLDKNKQRQKEAEIFQKEQKVAVIVGINSYDKGSGLRSLKYAVADANFLGKTLRRQGYTVRLLTNHQANKGYILSAIEQAGRLFKKNTGTFIFAYSGHGFAQGGTNYLAPYGTIIDRPDSSALALQEVMLMIRKTGIKHTALFIDASRNNPRIAGSRGLSNGGFIYARSRDMNILYSTSFGEVSWEFSQLGHSVFYYFLTKALQGKAADNDGIVSFNDIEDYVKINVSNWTFKHNRKAQRPFSNKDNLSDIVLGTSKRGKVR